jgi:hypothetical protein
MPHLVVIGGTDHRIYYNKLNGLNDSADIHAAITQALSASAGVGETPASFDNLSIFPNPAANSIQLHYSLSGAGTVTAEVLTLNAVKLSTLSRYQTAGNQAINMSLDNTWPGGYYLLRINRNGGDYRTYGFTIAR